MSLNVECMSNHAKTVLLGVSPVRSRFAHETPMKWEQTEWCSLNCFARTTNSCIASPGRSGTICWKAKAIR